MPFEIKKPFVPKKTFIINRNLHLDANDKVVEEGDPAGRKVLGGKGKAFYEEEAKHYGLDESHRLVEEKPEAHKAEILSQDEAREAIGYKAEPEAEGLGEEAKPPVEPEHEELKGKLPEDFPGHAALAEAGINTYGQLRKAGDVTEIAGIGPATAAKIEDALVAVPEE